MLGKPCYSQYEIYPISGYFSKLGAHQTMLEDKSRMDAFLNALKELIIPGKSIVLDIGTGTGILAMMAAKFGAKQVFAIESYPIINIAREIARDNGLG
ncbi:MAG: protein arginine N-methyltransferase 1 [Parcubacteria group bacterium Licking1014_1]|nr:MAG: protein arginine N-methyltransferase 1 [Parcubacteria group bacterium Licking1014_1]